MNEEYLERKMLHRDEVSYGGIDGAVQIEIRAALRMGGDTSVEMESNV